MPLRYLCLFVFLIFNLQFSIFNIRFSIFNPLRAQCSTENTAFLPGEEDTPAITEVEVFKERFLLKDTDEGREYLKKIADLEDLLSAYRTGLIKQQ